MALVNIPKWVLASSSFTIWSIMMKLHKNDRSNKALYKLRNFVIWGYLPLPWGYIHVQNHEKIYIKSEFKAVPPSPYDLVVGGTLNPSSLKAVPLKLTANVQSDNSFLWCSKFTPLELSAPAPNVQRNGFWPLVPLLFGVSLWNFTKMIDVTKALH